MCERVSIAKRSSKHTHSVAAVAAEIYSQGASLFLKIKHQENEDFCFHRCLNFFV